MHPRGTIERYVASGLRPNAEATLRAHLAACVACRAYYDEQRSLARALAGDMDKPTVREDDGVVARVTAVAFPAPASAPDIKSRLRRLLAPRPLFAFTGAVLAALLVLVVVKRPVSPPAERALAAHILHAEHAHVGAVALDEGAALSALAVVEVDDDGVLELSVERGGTVRAYPGARFALGERGETVVLDAGKVWCLVDAGKGSVEVSTKAALVHVVGTSFIVESRADDTTDVRVVSGKVDVTDGEERGKVSLTADQGTHVALGTAPEAARRVSTSRDVADWQHFLDRVLKQLQDGVRALGKKLQHGMER